MVVVVYAWCTDALPYSVNRKRLNVTLGMMLYSMCGLLVFAGLPSNGRKHDVTLFNITYAAEDQFVSHILTLVSLFTRHVFISICRVKSDTSVSMCDTN